MKRLVVIVLFGFCAACSDGKGDVNGLALVDVGEAAPTLQKAAEPKRVLIFGGTAGVGLATTKLALERGHTVTSISRRPERMTVEHPKLVNKKGDITKAASFADLLAEQDVIISAIGVGPGRKPITVYSEGIKNVLRSMQSQKLNRVITVTGIGAGDSKGHGGFFYDKILNPLMLAQDYKDKTRQEAILKESDVNWTIVRPGFLSDDPAENAYFIIQSMDGFTSGDISRQDVAHFLVALAERGLYSKKTVFITN